MVVSEKGNQVDNQTRGTIKARSVRRHQSTPRLRRVLHERVQRNRWALLKVVEGRGAVHKRSRNEPEALELHLKSWFSLSSCKPPPTLHAVIERKLISSATNGREARDNTYPTPNTQHTQKWAQEGEKEPKDPSPRFASFCAPMS